jgi:TolB-like protein
MMSCAISLPFCARNSGRNLVHYPMGMSAETLSMRLCHKCGAKMFAGEKSCGACLLESGLGLAAEDDLDLAPSQTTTDFGDYELTEEIGRGGQGVVYRALQKSLNRIVALKVIGLGRWAATPHLKRFRQEAEAAARLEHPQIVPIYEIGERDGSCYYSMKFIEGGQLDEVVRREPISPRRAAELLVKIARTVQFAHERGILHRDIKPGNILVDGEGEPHLTDFGLARLIEHESTITNSFDVLGTPSYMAPEQAAGKTKELTPAADVYSLGAAFYQMLTGQPPFAGGTTYETIRMVLETEPRNPRLWNPKVDVDLATICLKCLEKDPKRRYESAEALAQDVERWLRHEPILARRTGYLARGRKWLRRNPTAAVAIVALAALVTAVGIIISRSDLVRPPLPKGIAVLPFQNLGGDKDNAFVDGMQDDILTKLAEIADLRVISRTSVMSYRGPRSLQQIGQALNVSRILQGSVRKDGNRIHVNAQLIDVRTDTHVWAEEYNRNLQEVFAIQSEIAQKVAEQLHAKVSAAEKLALERPITSDPGAFDLYAQARLLSLRAADRPSGKEDLLEAVNLLNQATARDPAFFEAYCQSARTNGLLYLLGHDHTPARLASAESAVEVALHLRPDAVEVHLTQAELLYGAHLDYTGALAELSLAERGLPNNPRVFELRGRVERRQGKYEQALPSLTRALDLDPRNVPLLKQISRCYYCLRRYGEQQAVYDRVLAIDPGNFETKLDHAELDFIWKGDIRPLHETIESLRKSDPHMVRDLANSALDCAMIERDLEGARAALIAAGENTFFNRQATHFNRPFAEGFIAYMAGDEAGARRGFTAARAEQEKTVQGQPDYGPPLCVLGVIDAVLGRKEEALHEGRRAMELLPIEKDAINGPIMVEYFAVIAAWVGEKDLACEQLETLLRHPGPLNYGMLKSWPFWDPVRGYPRFEKIVNSLAPK